MKNHTAAFINAIAEEGTKAEAVEWLQKTWNENCELHNVLREIRDNTALDGRTCASIAATVLEELARRGEE